MPKHNPDGKNQYGDKNYPPDDVLHAALLQYAKESLTMSMRLDRLREEYGCEIKKSKLSLLNQKFNVPSVRRNVLPTEEQTALILEVVELDTTGYRGVKLTKATLARQGIPLPRDTIREVLRMYSPEASAQRFPGARSRRKERTTLVSVGPNEMHHADGWEKLGAQALMMGGVGIPAYGYTDQCSSKRLYVVVVPNDRLQDCIVHVHLDFVEHVQGIAITHVVDKGTELGKALEVHREIRTLCAPELDEEQFPPFVQITSFKNTPAEGDGTGCAISKATTSTTPSRPGVIDSMRTRTHSCTCARYLGVYTAHENSCLFYWIWPPVVQKALDEFTECWNIHPIRRQHLKANPSGYTPNHVYAAPRSLDLQDCKITVQPELIDALRAQQALTHEQALSFCSTSFDTAAKAAHASIGTPEISRDNTWSVFFTMLPVLRAIYRGGIPEKAHVFTL